MVGAAVVVLGLALFTVFGKPSSGNDNAPNDQWAVALSIVTAGCALLYWLGRRSEGSRTAA